MKLDEHDWINLIAALIMIGASIFAASYFYSIQKDECLKDPLVYGAKQMEESTGYEAVGSITLLIDDPMVRIPSITFTSKNLTIN